MVESLESWCVEKQIEQMDLPLGDGLELAFFLWTSRLELFGKQKSWLGVGGSWSRGVDRLELKLSCTVQHELEAGLDWHFGR